MARMKWTPEKIAELCRRYPHEDNRKLAEELGCSRKALAFRASFLGIKKSPQARAVQYAGMRAAEPSGRCARKIETGVVLTDGHITVHKMG